MQCFTHYAKHEIGNQQPSAHIIHHAIDLPYLHQHSEKTKDGYGSLHAAGISYVWAYHMPAVPKLTVAVRQKDLS